MMIGQLVASMSDFSEDECYLVQQFINAIRDSRKSPMGRKIYLKRRMSIMFMTEKCARAIAKLEKEAESVSGQQVPAIAIYNFLKEKCQNDELFASRVLIETKTLSKCLNYIMEFPCIKKVTSCYDVTMEIHTGFEMPSEELFRLVVDYYKLDDETVEQNKIEAREKAEKRKKLFDDLKRAIMDLTPEECSLMKQYIEELKKEQ